VNGYQPLVREVFVVRVWREAAGGIWRGQIVHLPTQETASFAGWQQAEAFMARFVSGPGSPPGAAGSGEGEGRE
jgi:hypothetical protein